MLLYQPVWIINVCIYELVELLFMNVCTYHQPAESWMSVFYELVELLITFISIIWVAVNCAIHLTGKEWCRINDWLSGVGINNSAPLINWTVVLAGHIGTLLFLNIVHYFCNSI